MGCCVGRGGDIKLLGVLSVGLALVVGSQTVLAARLDQVVCHQLRLQSQALVAAGVKRDLQIDGREARRQLSRERIRRVLTYIALTEKVLFQCPPPPPPVPARRIRRSGEVARSSGTGTEVVPVSQSGAIGGLRRQTPPLPVRKPRGKRRGAAIGPQLKGGFVPDSSVSWQRQFFQGGAN